MQNNVSAAWAFIGRYNRSAYLCAAFTRTRYRAVSHSRTNGVSGAAQHRGFNLVELMVVLAISAILLVVGVPSFNTFFTALRSNQVTSGLETAMSLARSEAIKSGRDNIVCAGVSDCSGDVDWSAGWLVKRDAFGVVAGEVLQVWPETPGDYTVSGLSEVRFRASGETAAGVTVDIQVAGAGEVYCVSVGPLGNVYTVEGACE